MNFKIIFYGLLAMLMLPGSCSQASELKTQVPPTQEQIQQWWVEANTLKAWLEQTGKDNPHYKAAKRLWKTRVSNLTCKTPNEIHLRASIASEQNPQRNPYAQQQPVNSNPYVQQQYNNPYVQQQPVNNNPYEKPYVQQQYNNPCVQQPNQYAQPYSANSNSYQQVSSSNPALYIPPYYFIRPLPPQVPVLPPQAAVLPTREEMEQQRQQQRANQPSSSNAPKINVPALPTREEIERQRQYGSGLGKR